MRKIWILGAVLLASVAAGTACGEGVFTDASLDGMYYVHDVFALLDGTGAIATGYRDFNGAGQVSALVTYASLSPLDYAVRADGAFREYSAQVDSGYAGTVGLEGGLAVLSPNYAEDAHPQVEEGFAALRCGVLQGSGYRDTDFSGSYSYHALVYCEDAWWNIYGAAQTNAAQNSVTLYRSGTTPRAWPFSVQSNGKLEMMDRGPDYATLTADGAAVFQTVSVSPRVDPLYLSGYYGLAVLLQRDESDKGFDPELFRGTYRVNELRVCGDGTITASSGAVIADSSGAFTGTLGGGAYAGRLSFYDSGVFTVAGDASLTGTISAGRRPGGDHARERRGRGWRGRGVAAIVVARGGRRSH